ncbi:type III-A CRISPR-associated RAMP protein Csm4 [Meiothermus ruber]|jgi:CRISPR-associated protein Csm4|uniref:CRISPR system Cms protein Csm4 n=1 Tax=Meiothermus ruber (strain ATCC 35948 / DSM 1279 / VKM B-1258 / 21) TaxID=504728 RepID=D3PLA2_MEIRD|nr:RAMP superfamily CRISPR-associated protein [Meiothermus ruber]ADD26998.1 CRISPR-associated RAMP protein, Csm4 family [Meiothermus ruber DSM 1279]AGK03452.1 Csm4 family CRISPR-associated RAMP protein [Meiothermus ruber DSM 1279]MCL6530836.1 CRISPR-associated protein Csm4 [Meiothermus ruber]MCX7802997.1 CRISPR-associated protein Csm4 [Meiothermus ruber]GAO73915.1 Csm4 family CRISPR-associated RAMP protein [Meiothermus ruber H328]
MRVRAFHLKLSSITAPPRAPTLWGHLAWWVRYTQGEEKLKEWLEAFQHDPPFLFSSAFPTGYLPRPYLPQLQVEDTQARKALKKIRYLSLKTFARVIQEGEQALRDAPELKEGKAPKVTLASQTRVGINRTTGTAQEGILFTDRVYWLNDKAQQQTWTVYAQVRQQADYLEQALREVGTFGYGGKASVGLGRFEVVDTQELELPEAENPTHYVILSPTLPQGEGFYALETYWGRLGGHFALAETPFKRPYLRAVEGSVFKEKPKSGLLDVTPAPAPEAGVRVWEYLYPFCLGVRI